MKKLLAYLAAHGVEGEVRRGCELWALSVGTLEGKVTEEWVRLTPSLAAVREFLGY